MHTYKIILSILAFEFEIDSPLRICNTLFRTPPISQPSKLTRHLGSTTCKKKVSIHRKYNYFRI